MDVPSCDGCRQRDQHIAALETRVAALAALCAKQQETLRRLDGTVHRLVERLAQYEPEVRDEVSGSASQTPTPPSPSYSLDAEKKRRDRRKRRPKKSPGRRPTELKFADAEFFRDVFPQGVRHGDCVLVRERAVWRLQDGRAVRIGYRIFAAPGDKEPRIPVVTPRCEYGLEILVVLAFLVYITGISLDKACAVLGFFCQLPLHKSQADALLRQLARHWESEFDILCDLIAHAAIVAMDETGWKIGTTHCSLWAFASQLQRVFLFGCNKDDATLDTILPPDIFTGVGISDDAAVYAGRFRRGQKCWAHLLRKAIRLALLYPRKRSYQRFLDQLLQLYRDAKRAAEDGRLGEAGRQQRVAALEVRLGALCRPIVDAARRDMKPHAREFANLAEELLRLSLAEELFTFVLVPEVEPTNNAMERHLRHPAMERKAGRTNQTARGAHRRSVIVSVIESLRANLAQFNLATVLEEVGRWMEQGISLFQHQWEAVEQTQAAATILNTT